MTLNKLIAAFIALASAASSGGCATCPTETTQPEPHNYSIVEQVPVGSSIGSQFGYKVPADAEMNMQVVAGLYAGTITAVKTGEGKFAYKGDYSIASLSNHIEKALKDADVNKDRTVTRTESYDLLLKVVETYAAAASSHEHQMQTKDANQSRSYTLDPEAREALLTIAGIYSGMITADELTDGDIGIQGEFSLHSLEDCFFLKAAYRDADTDSNMNVTKQEAETLLEAVLKKYATPYCDHATQDCQTTEKYHGTNNKSKFDQYVESLKFGEDIETQYDEQQKKEEDDFNRSQKKLEQEFDDFQKNSEKEFDDFQKSAEKEFDDFQKKSEQEFNDTERKYEQEFNDAQKNAEEEFNNFQKSLELKFNEQ